MAGKFKVAKLYALCVFIGSGKTSYAKKLEEEKKAIRLTMDEWFIPLFGEHMERSLFDQRRQALEIQFRKLAQKLLKQNINVIFDFGFWTKAARKDIRLWAEDNNIDLRIVYFDISEQECLRRALKRNDQKQGGAFVMTEEMFIELRRFFEPIEQDENYDIIIRE